VRKEHLMKEDPERLLEEGEEEFYYTEVDKHPAAKPNPFVFGLSSPLTSFTAHQVKPNSIHVDGNEHSSFHFMTATKDQTNFSFTNPSRARSYSSSDSNSTAKHLATLSLADHLDMARPAHEDPGRGAIAISTTASPLGQGMRAPRSILVSSSRHSSGSSGTNSSSLLMRSPPDPITMPITIAPSAVSVSSIFVA